MKSLKCDYVMDFIDVDFNGVLPIEIEAHLKECNSCKKYYEISQNLKIIGKVKEIDLKIAFLNRLKRKKFNFKLLLGVSIVLIVIFSVFWFRPINFSNGGVSSESSDSLLYFYTIASEM
ncbi:MAG: hypothetical protein N2258_05080 [Brevinematales bacterium]|nr:hypothetical protein [Brevinematales bacterium]